MTYGQRGGALEGSTINGCLPPSPQKGRTHTCEKNLKSDRDHVAAQGREVRYFGTHLGPSPSAECEGG